MELRELIRGIRDLGVYAERDWQEYLSCFTDDGLGAYLAAHSPARGGPLLERVLESAGVASARADPALPKVVPPADVPVRRGSAARPFGVISGCYDLLHLGHLRGMRQARRSLDARGVGSLWVLTLSDENIRAKKGAARPIMDLNERLALIGAVRYVDRVVPLVEGDCLAVVRALRPDIFFKAGRDREQQIVQTEMRLVKSLGGAVEFFDPDEPGAWTTTGLIEAVRAGLPRQMGRG